MLGGPRCLEAPEALADVDAFFGLVEQLAAAHRLAKRLAAHGTRFVIEPHVRFRGKVGEQATMFLLDPCGNALEFKAFKDMSQLFAK